MPTKLRVNGEEATSTRGPMTPLLDVLREELFLTGTKSACREGACGACTVHLDGRPVVSCLVPIGTVEGCDVHTVESLADGSGPSPLQQVMEEFDAVQCGMCFPGMLMTLTSFLRRHPLSGRDEIKAGLVGNICRCTGYERIVDAAVALARRN